MKNIFRFLMAVAVLLTASCAKEDISSSIVDGGEVEVTFSANLPELGTRANTYGNGANADILYYNVYEAGSNNQLGDLCGSVESNTGTFTFSLVLLKGMEYDLVFWAQDKDCGYYALNGKQITVDYTDVDANDDTRDAFFRYVEGFDPTSDTPSFKLYRPFGQLNAATSDYDNVKNNGVTLTTSSLKVTTFTKFNLETGIATDPVEVTFDATAMPCTLEPDKEILKSGYEYLSMNYLLPGTVDAEYTFKGKRSDNSEVKFTGTTYTNVPVKANFRTNILGKLLTASTDFTVTIEAAFDEPAEEKNVVSAYNAIDIKNAIDNAVDGEQTQITLGGDIDLNDLMGLFSTRANDNDHITIAKGKNIVIDLNGCTISGTDKTEKNFGLLFNNGNLTINDSKGSGKLIVNATINSGWNRYSAVISNNPGGVLIVNGGTIEHLGGTDMAYGIDNLTNGKGTSAVTTINGGTIKSPYRAIRQFLNGIEANNSLTINGGTIDGTNKSIFFHDPSKNANSGSLIVSENAALYGDVYLYVTEGSTEWPVEVSIANEALKNANILSANVPEGYYVTLANGQHIVTTAVAEVADVKYSNLADAIAAAKEINGTVKLLADITTTDKFVFKKGCDVTIDLNGKTLAGQSSTTGTNYNFLDANGGTLTVKNGTITAEFKGANMGWNNSTNIFNITAGGVLNLADVTAKNLGGSDMGFVAHLNNWGEVTLNVENSTLEANYVAVRAFNSGNDKNNITINNSTLKGGNYAFWVHNFTKVDFGTEEKMIAHYNLLNLNMFNNGNTFVGKNDTPIRLGFTNSVYCAADVNHIVATPESLNAALKAGGKVALANDIVYNLEKTIALNGKELTLNGNGFTVSQAEECNNSIALIDITGGKATIENVVFDGIKNGAVVRTVDTDLEVDNVTTQNCTHNVDVGQGLFRLRGKNTIKNSTFKNNTSSQGLILTLNYDGGNPELPQVVDNCVFENNVCGATAVLYYVKGSSCTINGNKFIGNTVNCETNGATVYMGFQENCVITNNIFKNNTVNEASTSKRVAGALMIGYAAEITGNAFIGNKVTGERAVANNVCASAYYTDIDLSGNYWGGLAPKENDDYFNEYPNNCKVIVNDYLSSYIE